jgi:hypothetical protein
MKLTPQLYTLSTTDRERIEALGYVIEGLPADQKLENLLPSLLPNFNLPSLLDVVEKHFAPTTSLPIKRRIIYRDPSQSLQVLFHNLTNEIDEVVVFDRTFYKQKGELFVDHNHCIVPKNYQGIGLIKPVFQASLQQYVNMDIRKIIVRAALGSGGYVWARYGFVAVNRNEVEKILKDAHNKLSVNNFKLAEKIFKKYYLDYPTGTNFPMILWTRLPAMKDILCGSEWYGELDLHNPEQIRNFSNYVFRK